MLKQLLENRTVNLDYMGFSFQHHVYELQNCVEVLGIEAKWLQVENNQIAVAYMDDNSIFIKSMHYGKTMMKLTDGIHEANVHLSVLPSGEINVEVKPYIGNANIVSVYFRAILADTAIAIDLKGALKNFLIANRFMNDGDSILEVHYQSMHPNVLKDSYAGNFVLGCHPMGGAITNCNEYALANRIANLKFTKIVILQDGVHKIIALKMLLSFVISNRIFVNNELSMDSHLPLF
ncbi:hypothetical protein FC756_02180 [Lysinibacillus mangiferihumi]|uniref:Uncharacterized protein n=1 Tax=Lysinibacillus mangiferihumi TaxID=1130819 RepID=A0A4U2ZER0_9BACI|nr:hypothetical protein [Lysinibacillus mangiferihumi]TKI72332.1 hypothetical protein FC756_02180 [Lysinibacillus mangiferihumi]